MSRTYRTFILDLDRDHKPFGFRQRKFRNRIYYYGWGETAPCDYYSRHNQKWDSKPWYKPSKEYKKMQIQIRRAKEKASMKKQNYDNIPKFRKTNVWDWT